MLAKGDADIFDDMMRIDVKVAFGPDDKVNQTMACDLVEHVLKEGNTGFKFCLAAAIEINLDGNAGFQRITLNLCGS